MQIAENEDDILLSLAAAAEVDLALARGRLGVKTGATIPKVRGGGGRGWSGGRGRKGKEKIIRLGDFLFFPSVFSVICSTRGAGRGGKEAWLFCVFVVDSSLVFVDCAWIFYGRDDG